MRWERSRQEVPGLAALQIGYLGFVHAQDDAILVERCDLKQHVAAPDGRTDRAAQVAAHDHAFERRNELRAREEIVEQSDLCARLLDLGERDAGLNPVALAQRAIVGELALLALGDAVQAFEAEVAIVQRRELLILRHDIAGASHRAANESIVRSDDGALHAAFDARIRGHPIGRLDDEREEQQKADAQRCEFPAHVSRTEHPQLLFFQRLDQLDGDR